jgi:hypothetical protein
VVFRVDFPARGVQPRNETVVRAHFGPAGEGPEMDPGGWVDWLSGQS